MSATVIQALQRLPGTTYRAKSACRSSDGYWFCVPCQLRLGPPREWDQHTTAEGDHVGAWWCNEHRLWETP